MVKSEVVEGAREISPGLYVGEQSESVFTIPRHPSWRYPQRWPRWFERSVLRALLLAFMGLCLVYLLLGPPPR